MRKSLNLFFSVDRAFSMGFFSTLVPLLKNFSDAVTPIINVVDVGLSEEFLKDLRSYLRDHPKKPVLNIVEVPEDFLEPFKHQTYPLNEGVFRTATLAKIGLPVLFPDKDFGVYIDCDIYVQKDFSELLQYEGGEANFYAVKDRYIHSIDSSIEKINSAIYEIDPHASYFNGGFFVMDLKNFDRQAYWKKIKEVSQKGKLHWEDQSLMNITLCNQWSPLPESWNKMIWPQHLEYSFPAKNTNYHFFGGQKPWAFSPRFSLGLVPEFYRILKDNPIKGFEIPKPNRPHGLWWIKNMICSALSRNPKAI